MLAICLILLTLNGNVYAAERESAFPDVLDLNYVLREVDVSSHHLQLMRQAERVSAESIVAETDADYATAADINLHARWIDANELSIDPSSEDHKATLNISKRLYDFGVSGNLEASNRSFMRVIAIDDDTAISMHRIEIARRFFDVLLADLASIWADEAMAMEFVTLDKLRDRFELRQIDEIAVLESESRYQAAHAERTRASLRQRVSRSRLAEILASPDALPSVLRAPELPDLLTPAADAVELIDVALANSPELKAREQEVESARQRYEAESNRWQPSLDAEIELAEYARDLPNREDWSAELRLRIPILENGMSKAGAARAWSELQQALARLEASRAQTREDVYATWENIGYLISRSRAHEIALRHAERALDKSRGEYELELRTDFGDSLVRVSRIRYESASTQYQLAIERMKLALMQGEDPLEIVLGESYR